MGIPRIQGVVVPLVLIGVVGMADVAQAAPPDAPNVLPHPEPPFQGKIGMTAQESTPDFPAPVTAPAGAPNIVVIITDDVGFGATSTFGGPIPTPTFDRLAENGLRYNQFHTTALCSPTRAALLTGRNHHQCATGVIMEMATGFPGYNSAMPQRCGTVAEVLQQNGYGTAWFGKNHNVPEWQSSAAGPFDLWPQGLGFDYFYGFLGGDIHQYEPALYENTIPVERPHDDPGYILDRDLADHAIQWVRTQHALDPKKPFFLYYASGTAHAPHHAPKDWIEKFDGAFDEGWDVARERTLARQIELGVVPRGTELTPRPEGIPAWDSLSDDEKRLYAHMMEVYAGALANADHEIGRVLDAIAEEGELENTLVIYVQGDNGASAEGGLQGTTNEVGILANGVTETLPFLLSSMEGLGGPLYYNHYPAGWAIAMDTPFQWAKQVASHFGGTRNGMVMSWPGRIHQTNEVRSQFHHVVDIAPTILAAAGLSFPDRLDGVDQEAVAGVSMAYTFDDANAASQRTTQYFEMLGNRAIYQDGWVAATTPLRVPWVTHGVDPDPEMFPWELYHVTDDFSESRDLAAEEPAKLAELQGLWLAEAERYDVLPLDARTAGRVDVSTRPSLEAGRRSFTYHAGMGRIPEGAAPDVKNRSWSISTAVDVPNGGEEGVLATLGGRYAGWSLLVWQGRPAFVYALSNQPQDKSRIVAEEALSPGRHTVRFDFVYDGGGIGRGGDGTLKVDGRSVAKGHISRTVPTRFSIGETFDVGLDHGTPVVEEYADRMPFAFTGTIDTVDIELGEVSVSTRVP